MMIDCLEEEQFEQLGNHWSISCATMLQYAIVGGPTKGANKRSFFVQQHGGDDVTRNITGNFKTKKTFSG